MSRSSISNICWHLWDDRGPDWICTKCGEVRLKVENENGPDFLVLWIVGGITFICGMIVGFVVGLIS